jgi:hypothetical protein
VSGRRAAQAWRCGAGIAPACGGARRVGEHGGAAGRGYLRGRQGPCAAPALRDACAGRRGLSARRPVVALCGSACALANGGAAEEALPPWASAGVACPARGVRARLGRGTGRRCVSDRERRAAEEAVRPPAAAVTHAWGARAARARADVAVAQATGAREAVVALANRVHPPRPELQRVLLGPTSASRNGGRPGSRALRGRPPIDVRVSFRKPAGSSPAGWSGRCPPAP